MVQVEVKVDRTLDERERKEKIVSQIDAAIDKLDSIKGDILYGTATYDGYTFAIEDHKKEGSCG